MNVSKTPFQAALASVTGDNHHDWLIELSQLCGKTYDETCEALTQVWIQTDLNKRKSLRFIVELRKATSTK